VRPRTSRMTLVKSAASVVSVTARSSTRRSSPSASLGGLHSTPGDFVFVCVACTKVWNVRECGNVRYVGGVCMRTSSSLPWRMASWSSGLRWSCGNRRLVTSTSTAPLPKTGPCATRSKCEWCVSCHVRVCVRACDGVRCVCAMCVVCACAVECYPELFGGVEEVEEEFEDHRRRVRIAVLGVDQFLEQREDHVQGLPAPHALFGRLRSDTHMKFWSCEQHACAVACVRVRWRVRTHTEKTEKRETWSNCGC
jgi:hypothetical protein